MRFDRAVAYPLGVRPTSCVAPSWAPSNGGWAGRWGRRRVRATWANRPADPSVALPSRTWPGPQKRDGAPTLAGAHERHDATTRVGHVTPLGASVRSSHATAAGTWAGSMWCAAFDSW